MDSMLLMRLRDCAVSSRLGMRDRGFPDKMQQLAALGYVAIGAAGATVTQLGLDYLASDAGMRELAKL